MNELIFLLMIVISLFSIYLLYKYLKNDGLYIWLVVSYLLSFILSFKIGLLFNFSVVVNIPIYLSSFLTFYLLIEKNSKLEFKKIFSLVFFVSIINIIYLLFTINYSTSIWDNNSINLSFLMQNNYFNVYLLFFIYILDLLLIKCIYIRLRSYYSSVFISYSVSSILVQLLDSCLGGFVFYLNTGNSFFDVVVCSYICRLIISFFYYFVLKFLCEKKKVKK